MARLMSVALTEDAVRAEVKTETRRLGWSFLTVGEQLELCRKVMGRRRGDPLVRICKVVVVAVRREPLDTIDDDGVRREGFTRDHLAAYGDPEDSLSELFIRFFVAHMRCTRDQLVTVIEWRYL